ncbi:MAG: hypothetical protein DRG78_20125 [Epsilonproteobacteria bacterium]|nr:MAG: hypothetical protein DRG78_20125 [Campylobacterota bacterium]
MRNRIIYGIIKTYKGIFKKKHIGNVQILIIEKNESFSVYNVVGEMKDNEIVSQLVLKAPSEYTNIFIDEFEENQHFIQMEELYCSVTKEKDKFKVILKKKGKYINSNLIFSFSKEYSEGNMKVYLIEGKMTPLIKEQISNRVQLKMSAIKKKAMSRPIISKFISSIKR